MILHNLQIEMDGYYEGALKIIRRWLSLDIMKQKVHFSAFIYLAIFFLTGVQEILFLLDEKSPMVDKLASISSILMMFEATVKFSNGLRHHRRIKKVMDELDETYQKMEPEDQERYKALALSLRKIAHVFFSFYLVAVWCFFTFPVAIMLKIKYFSDEWVQLYPFFFWWPFKHQNFYFLIYVYEIFVGQVSEFAAVMFDMLYMMILAQIVAQYRYVRDSFTALIEGISEAKGYGTKHKERFAQLVELQSKLNKHCDDLNDIFGVVFFVRVTLTSIIICFSGFVLVTQTNPIVQFQFWNVIAITLMHTFFLCFLGNMIEEEVCRLSRCKLLVFRNFFYRVRGLRMQFIVASSMK